MKILFLVMSGGYGRRLWPVTLFRQKTLFPAGNGKRIIDYAIQSGREIEGVETKTVVLARYKSYQVVNYVISCYPKVDIFVEPRELDTGGAMLQHWYKLREHNPDVVVVLNGDHMVNLPVKDLILKYQSKNNPALLLVGKRSDERYHDYIDVGLKPEKLLHKFHYRKSKIAYTGIFLAKFDILDEYMINLPIGGYNMTRDIVLKIHSRYGGDFYLLEKEWEDLGTWKRYLKFFIRTFRECK